MQAAVIPLIPAVSIQRILYATDFSEASLAALPIAANLARRYGSQLYITHIWSALPASMSSSAAAISVYDQLQKTAVASMGNLLKAKELEGLLTTSIVEEGSPTVEIGRILELQNIDLMVIGTHGRTGINHLLMGSIAEQICRSATCPVLTAGPNVEKRFRAAKEVRSILFPTDLSQESLAVMPYVASISSEFSAIVNVLHVLPAETGSNPDARALAEPLRKQMQQICDRYLSPRCHADCAIEFGDTADVILKADKQNNADFIAMGIRNAFALGLHLQNTLAYKVIIGATCPVLTYRTKH